MCVYWPKEVIENTDMAQLMVGVIDYIDYSMKFLSN